MRVARALTAGILVVVAGCNGQVSRDGSETDSALRQVPRAENNYTLFESLQVRRSRCRRTAGCCSRQHAGQPARDLPRRRRRPDASVGSVVVGLEPVAVAARSDNEVWVVNHLSDSVSIVDAIDRRRRRAWSRTLSSATSRATSSSPARTTTRAFITTAHRGQNTGDDPHAVQTPAARPRRRLGVRRQQPRRRRRRHAPRQADAVRRHAARARRVSADGTRSTPPRSSPATRPRSFRPMRCAQVYPDGSWTRPSAILILAGGTVSSRSRRPA